MAVINVAAGNDTLAGTGLADVITGLGGNDKINGFQSGSDVIEIGALLFGFGVNSIEDAFNGGYLKLTSVGAGTLVEFDKDGSGGGAAALTVATVVGATILQTDFDYGVT